MQNIQPLNSKKTKELLKILESQYGTDYSSLIKNYILYINKDNKIFIINKEFSQLDTSKVRINSLGLYLGELHNNQLRTSIEGSQLLGKDAKKNVIEIDISQKRAWLRGKDMEIKHENTGFLIVKCKTQDGIDFLCSGKVKSNNLMNFIPKNRRIASSD